MFRDTKVPDEHISMPFKLKDKANWNIHDARQAVREDRNWENAFTEILYRPFDVQHIFYHDAVVERSRKNVMRHMMNKNISLCFMRQVSLGEDLSHFIVSNSIVDNRTFLSSKGIIQQAPLYLYPDMENNHLFSAQEQAKGKQTNINPDILSKPTANYPELPSPEMIFYYTYAVLYSKTYRKKYAAFLKIDFPRISFTNEYDMFRAMAEYGKNLTELHLMKSPDLDSPIAKFQSSGDNCVDKLRYDNKNSRVYINKEQY